MDNINESFEQLLESYEPSEVGRRKVVEGVVTEIAPTHLTVDFGWKGAGIVPVEELVCEPTEYKVGQKIKVRIEKMNEEEGSALLSEKAPMMREIREKIKNASQNGQTVKGKILEAVKGGYRVLIEGVVEGFLPGSESLLGKDSLIPREKLEFEVISYEERGRRQNIVLSRKRLLEKQVERFFNEHRPGDVVEGVVESIEDFGAFVLIGTTIRALLPNREISYDPKVTAKDSLKIGKTIKAEIKDINQKERKLTLSLKTLMNDPWEDIERKYQVGSVVNGIVTSIKPFGFFVKIEPGVEGLVPVAEVFWGRQGKIADVVSVGEPVKVEVLSVDPEKRKILLSYKKTVGDPWEKIEEKYEAGNIVNAKILKVLPNGAIIELEEGITGFCNVSEISWNFVDNPETVLKDGEKVKVYILDVDKTNRKIKLSIRKAIPNPWLEFAAKHKEGDTVNGKIIKKVEKGFIGLVEDIEVYIPKSLSLEDTEVGTEFTGKITKLEKHGDIYKIIVNLKEEEVEEVK